MGGAAPGPGEIGSSLPEKNAESFDPALDSWRQERGKGWESWARWQFAAPFSAGTYVTIAVIEGLLDLFLIFAVPLAYAWPWVAILSSAIVVHSVQAWRSFGENVELD